MRTVRRASIADYKTNSKPYYMPGVTRTYRAGQPIELIKAEHAFVVRELPSTIQDRGLTPREQVSSASTVVQVAPSECDDLMDTVREYAVAHHLYYLSGTDQEILLTDRVLLRFADALDIANINSCLAEHHLVLLRTYQNGNLLCQLTDDTGCNPAKLVARLTEADNGITYADLDLNYRIHPSSVSDPFFLRQWHLHDLYSHPELSTGAGSSAQAAWDLLGNLGDPSVVVGLTDDGCDLTHHDFDSAGKFAGWAYFKRSKLTVGGARDRVYQPNQEHGTSVAGVIAAEADGIQTVGVAPGCRLFPVKWESEGSTLFISDSKFLTMLEEIGDHVDILCNSWGNVPSQIWSQHVISTVAQLTRTGGRRGRGILFLFAAGNENVPLNYDGDVAITYAYNRITRERSMSRYFSQNLADQPGVLYVGATASTKQRAYYSNYGPGLSLCAPSSNVHPYGLRRLKGLNIVTTEGNQGFTFGFGGTSAACPIVAGVAALVLSAHPGLKALEVAHILLTTASKDLDLTPYEPLANTPAWDRSPASPFADGYFRDIQHPAGTWSPWFGFGKVDAEAAVRLALERKAQDTPAPTADSPALRIIAILPNPIGTDRENEVVYLFNGSSSAILLDKWVLMDSKDRKEVFTTTIAPNAMSHIKLRQARLPNRGGSLALKDNTGKIVDEITYEKSQVKPGQLIIFRNT